MPQSDYWAVPYVVESVIAADPGSVLDIGVGIGQFGLQIRQVLEIARGRLRKREWKTKLDGIELFEPYRNPIWDYFYDHVRIGDARTLVASCDQHYDLVLLCDVIEHFEQAQAVELLHSLRKIAKQILITTPVGHYPQGAVHGNEAETHRSEWTPAEFRKMGALTHEIRGTFLAMLPGEGETRTVLKDGDLPMLFEQTAGSWWRCTRSWFPRMIRKRLGFN